MAFCLIGIGTNLGDRKAQLDAALRRIDQHPSIRVIRVSRPIETAPVGGPGGQDCFLNAAIVVETELEPTCLLRETARIERAAGRDRETVRPAWSARPLDLDILLYDQRVVDEPRLQIPHPMMVARRFVLQPAAEIAGNMVHPLCQQSVERLWQHLRDTPDRYAILSYAAGELAAKIARSANVVLLSGPPSPWIERGSVESTSSVFDSGRALESATRARECLQHRAWSQPSESEWPGCLADFWLEEWNMFESDKVWGAPTGFPTDSSVTNASRPLDHSRAVHQPKLLLIPPRETEVAKRAAQSGLGATRGWPNWSTIEKQLMERATRMRIPFVRIRSNDREDTIRIAAGAIRAMLQQ